METQVIIGTLKEDDLGYSKGATVITCNGRDEGTAYIFGLIKDEGDEYWGNFVQSYGIKLNDEIAPFYDIRSSETLSQLSILTMKGLLKLPANYFN